MWGVGRSTIILLARPISSKLFIVVPNYAAINGIIYVAINKGVKQLLAIEIFFCQNKPWEILVSFSSRQLKSFQAWNKVLTLTIAVNNYVPLFLVLQLQHTLIPNDIQIFGG